MRCAEILVLRCLRKAEVYREYVEYFRMRPEREGLVRIAAESRSS